MALPQRKLPPVRYAAVALVGGMDQTTPTLSLPPGVIRRGTNFMCSVNGGYSRIGGYERFDGKISPSTARYRILFTEAPLDVAIGDWLVGEDSEAEAKVIQAISPTTYLLGRMTVDEFAPGEVILLETDPVGVVVDVTSLAATGLEDAQYKWQAAEDRRADIQAVPGEGPIVGLQYYKGHLYAWRAAAGGASVGVYRTTPTGWEEISLGEEISFTTGTVAIEDGAAVEGGTSGAEATVARVVLESGSWTEGDAAGRLILTGRAGDFEAESLLVDSSPVAQATGASSTIELLPGGRFRTVVGNIGGGEDSSKIYGADGENRGFEFDGEVFVPIATGMADDTPDCVAVHKQHLFFSFGSSLQFSSIGDPYRWSVVLGAGEIALDHPVVALIRLPGDQTSGALAIYTESDTSILYGSSSQDFSLGVFNTEAGAFPYTEANLEQTYVLGQQGVTSLAATLSFGNFVSASLTMPLRPYLAQRKNMATAAMVSRTNGQYRVFFSDGSGIYLTILNGQFIGATPISFDHPVLCATSGYDSSGDEALFFGSENGMVYQLDRGSSFDGAPIEASFALVFNAVRSPRILKNFMRASVEMTGDSYAEFFFGYDLGYRSLEYEQPVEVSHVSGDLRPAYWDAFTWDNFVWDGRDIIPGEVTLFGCAENLAIRITSTTPYFYPFTINSIIMHYTERAGLQ